MKKRRILSVTILALTFLILSSQSLLFAQSLKENNELLFDPLQQVHGLSNGQMDSIRTIFRESGYIGQGNPGITKHPMTPAG